MKNLFNIWLAIGLLGFLGSFVSFSNSDSKKVIYRQKLKPSETNIVIEKVYQLNGLVRNEIQLDTTKFGVCDTCSASFASALSLNRKLVDSLQIQNSKLFEKFIEAARLNQELEKVNKLVENQITKSKGLVNQKL